MKRTRTNSLPTRRTRMVVVIAALAIMDGLTTLAQQTNRVSQADFSNFQIISERNIFNPNRIARRRRTNRPEAVADAFSLVGTMSYAKGTFAFFDGTTSEYRKALTNAGTIAGYRVTDITPTSVKLTNGDKQLVMKIGAQMRREEKGSWQLVASSELPVETAENMESAPAATTETTSDSSSEGNDVLKRLMQQREKELQ